MKYTQFVQKDEKQVVDLWNRSCKADRIDLHRFRKQALLDENFDTKLAWTAKKYGKVIGFILATKRKFPYLERGLEPERGWVNVMFVDPDYQRKGIGTELYRLVEEELLCMQVKNITLGAYSPNYFFSGIDENNYPEAASFFLKQGYQKREKHYSMEINLSEYECSEKIVRSMNEKVKQGYQFSQFDSSLSLELLDFLKDEFGGGWKRSALISMQNNTAESVIYLVFNPSGNICGFCMSAIDGNPERFGPIGIAKNERNTGIGSLLLAFACSKMKQRGIKRIYFMSTDEAGKRFYERNGFRLIRTYVDYRKEI